MEASHKEMMAWLTDRNDTHEETMACPEKMEARLGKEEPTSEDIEPEVADEEVPVEDTVVMPVGEPRNRHRDQRNLAAERCKRKQQDLVTARRGMTRRAQVA
jgi:hypothetical protein